MSLKMLCPLTLLLLLENVDPKLSLSDIPGKHSELFAHNSVIARITVIVISLSSSLVCDLLENRDLSYPFTSTVPGLTMLNQ